MKGSQNTTICRRSYCGLFAWSLYYKAAPSSPRQLEDAPFPLPEAKVFLKARNAKWMASRFSPVILLWSKLRWWSRNWQQNDTGFYSSRRLHEFFFPELVKDLHCITQQTIWSIAGVQYQDLVSSWKSVKSSFTQSFGIFPSSVESPTIRVLVFQWMGSCIGYACPKGWCQTS